MARKDPLRNFRFRVEIDGIAVAGFSEAIIGPTTTEAIDYREGTDPPHVRKLSGLTKFGNIRLSRGIADAWPTKYESSALNATGNEVMIETLELANEGIERVQ